MPSLNHSLVSSWVKYTCFSSVICVQVFWYEVSKTDLDIAICKSVLEET